MSRSCTAVAAETPLKDTKLILEIVPGMAECDECDEIFNVVGNEGYCPNCGNFEKTVLTGRDFNIRKYTFRNRKKALQNAKCI